MKSITSKQIIGTGLIVAMALVFLGLMISQNQALGSVSVTDEYFATTTRSFNGTAMLNLQVLTGTEGRGGTLGSVVITGAGAGQMNFFDATTSNVNLRTGSTATSTILIATFPLSAAAGTYTFDVRYETGLMVEIIGTAPTSTITLRR